MNEIPTAVILPITILAVLRKARAAQNCYIHPPGNVEGSLVNLIKASVENFYRIKCIIKPALVLTDDILADSKTRYQANRILSKI